MAHFLTTDQNWHFKSLTAKGFFRYAVVHISHEAYNIRCSLEHLKKADTMLMNRVLDLKDPESLKEAIKAASLRPPSQSEMLAQRVSFVFASVSEKSGLTKEQVRLAVASATGTACF